MLEAWLYITPRAGGGHAHPFCILAHGRTPIKGHHCRWAAAGDLARSGKAEASRWFLFLVVLCES